jgi:hypothetical protein
MKLPFEPSNKHAALPLRGLGLAIVFVSAAAQIGCATSDAYKPASLSELSDRWIGASPKELLQVWGDPDERQELPDGRRAFVYNRQEFISVPIGTCTDGSCSWRQLRLFCETTFYFSPAGIVDQMRARGNDCVKRRPA